MRLMRVLLGILVALGSSGIDAKTPKESVDTIVKSHFALNEPYFEKQEGGVELPAGFLKGVAYSTYQNSGHHYWPSLGYRPKSNWTFFENNHSKRFFIDRQGKRKRFPLIPFQSASPIDRGEKVGISADTWNHLFEDIQLMKDLGVNSLRFEFPWTDLNPGKGVWNEEAFALFDRYIDALIENGIEVVGTLYHWVHPRYFQKLGGWEKAKNSVYFVEYCREVFKRFGHKVHTWLTINEPTVVSACGYVLGSHAPGKQAIYVPGLSKVLRQTVPGYARWCRKGLTLAGRVLGNMLKAHCDVYEALKQMPHGDASKISLVHQMALFEGPSYNPAISEMRAMFANDVFINFFKTGQYYYPVDAAKGVRFSDSRAPKSLDFIGLNFYATVTLNPDPTCEKGETLTDMVWAIRPHSMYEALKKIATLGVPIMITENGIPDAKDDRREKWIVGYMNALKRAIDEGIDVSGFFFWSLLDNFEWNMGHNKKFGLYAVDTLSNDPTKKERRLREGSKAYRDYVQVAQSQEKSGNESILHSPRTFPSNPSSITERGFGN
jgi:beta-glucosidase